MVNMSIPSPYRIPSSDLGVSLDQRAITAFLVGRQHAFWGFNGAKRAPLNGEFGLLTDNGSFTILRKDQLNGKKVKVWRNIDLLHEPARWWSMSEFAPLKPVRAEPNWWPPAQWANEIKASRQTSFNDFSRYFELPFDPETVKLPPAPDSRFADRFYLVDDDTTGVTGIETLGLRPLNELVMNFINNVLCNGKAVATVNDWVVDSAYRRTADNMFRANSRGCGPIPRRVGVWTPRDVLVGWDESKAVSYPNVQYGPGATAEPGYRVEHTAARQRRENEPYPMGDDPRMIKHGARLTSTRAMEGSNGIKRWADDEGFTGDLKKSAITNAVGCSEFGITCSTTGGGRAGVEAVNDANEEHRVDYAAAGFKNIPADGWRLMRNLFTRETMVVSNPAPIGVRK